MQNNGRQDIIQMQKDAKKAVPERKKVISMFFDSMSMTTIWLAAMIVLLLVEAAAPGLVSIWFALGALAAMISSMLHAKLWLQAVWFCVISLVSLWLTRPLAKKYVNARTTPTNADMVIGKECIVTEEIDNALGTGAVSVGGKIWTARLENPETHAEKGTKMNVLRIEGVKLIVKAAE